MIVPPPRPTVCPTEAHHRLAWAADGSNAATCVLPPATGRAARGYVAAYDTAAQAAARCCRHVVYSWHAPLDGLTAGHWSRRSTAPQSGGMPSLAAWLADKARARDGEEHRT